MKKICPNLSNKQTAQEFGEMKRIFGEDMAHSLWSKNNGYSIDKAPNGAPSILYGNLLELCEGDHEQAMILKAKVYSDEFFKWFGDWTTEDKSNVSKVVDENGEPKAVYHTVGAKFDPSFKKFDTHIEGRETAIYHTDSLGMSTSYNMRSASEYAAHIKDYDSMQGVLEKLSDVLMGAREHTSPENVESINTMLKEIKDGTFMESNHTEFNPFAKDSVDNALSLLSSIFATDDGSEHAWSVRQRLKDLTQSYDMIVRTNNAAPKSRYNLKNALKNVKIDFLNIKNPKVFDAEGRDWRHVTRKNKSNKQAYQEFLEILDKTNPEEILRHIGVSAHTNVANWSTRELQHLIDTFKQYLKNCIERNEVLTADGIPQEIQTLQEMKGVYLPMVDPITGEDYGDSTSMSTRDLEEKYLHQGDPKTVRETERAIKFLQSGLLNLESVQYDAKPVFGGLTFKQDAHSITVDYNGASTTISKYMLDNEVFKNRVTNFLLKVQDEAQKKAVEEGVDGVIISNVLDYGNGNNVSYGANTVYECIDNSQVKSIYNSGKYEDPNDMYNTIDDRVNHLITIQIAKPYLAEPTKPYLKSGLSKTDRQQLLANLREYDPQLSIKCNADGKWYITRSKAKISAFKKQLDPSGLISKDKVLEYLRGALKGSPELMLVETILNHATTGKWGAIKFKIGGLEQGVAAQFNPEDHSITIATGAMVKFRNNANLEDYVAQTILHELVHYYTYEALHNSSQLRQEAEELRRHIIDKLGDKADEYGLTDIYEMLAELTNVDFVNKLKSIEMPERKLSAILQKVKRFLNHVLGKVFNAKEKGTAYEQAIELLVKASRPEQFAVPYDVKDDHTAPMKSITAALEEIDKIHGRITSMYQDLYKSYQKQSNKSANKAKREDAIWSTIQDLKAKDKALTLEVSMMSALEQIGVFETDTTGTVIQASPTTILGFLQQEYMTNKLTNLTANQVQDMKANIIDFYNNLSREVNDLENTVMEPQDNELRLKLLATVGEISRLWKIAANNVADRLVDENIDKYITASEAEKQDMKIVAKNWLHRNDMWGDEGRFTAFFNYSRNNSPIIRQAFQIIQDADAATRKESLEIYTKLAKAFKAASSLVDLATPGNWQTEFMERYTSGPKKGQFTGLFKSELNHGQFKYDQEEFIKDLNKRFDDKYGYHYVIDKITGEPYRSDTGASVEDEEWTTSGVVVTAPPYIEYLQEKEQWLCDHAERRYTSTYYMERLSEPFSSDNPRGHGLSPKTILRMDYINSHITHIIQSCSEDGIAYPERLSDADYKKLQMWRDALTDLGNIFDAEGNLKEGEAYKMASEIQAWNDFKQQYAFSDIDYTEFDNECQKIIDEVNAGKRPYSDYLRFVDMNSEWGIDTRLFDKVFKGNTAIKYYLSRMWLNSMKNLIKTKSAFVKDFHGVLWRANPDGTIQPSDMFALGKLADANNEAIRRRTKSDIDPKEFQKYFHMEEALYHDDSGMILSKDGTKTFDPKTAPAGQYMTWYDYILNQYVDAVLDGRMKNAIGYDEVGNPVVADFTTMTTRDEVKKWLNDYVFTYEALYINKKTGEIVKKRELSSMFKTMWPNDKSYIRTIPKGRFANSTSGLNNAFYSTEDKSGVQPRFDIYGDDSITMMLNKGYKKAQYYKLLLDTMEECWKMLGVDESYNRFKLPQIEASKSQKLGRAAHNIKGTLKNIKENMVSATSDDLDMRDDDDYVLRNGRWVLNSAPMRFINELEDPNMIDSDLASTVGRFAEMAINFKNKSQVQSKLDALGYALDDENRDTEFKGRGQRLKERYDKMMKQLFFEAKNTTFAGQYEKPGKMSIAATKGLNTLRTATAYLMLGYNIPSMATGLWDAATQLPSHAARGERFGFKDLAKAFACNPAAIIRAIMNIGNPIPNCKQIAMMQKDGLVRSTRESYNKQYRNRLVKALAESATGGYTMGDYMINLLIQRAAYNAKKYYPGEPAYGIPEGFYTKEQFNALMDGKADSKTIHDEFLRGNNMNLWDAYTFDGRVAKVKPGYENAVANSEGLMSANIQQLAALVNGNSPKNDQSSVSQNVIFKCFSLMRNYFFRRIEHWFAGYTPDNIVKTQKEVVREEIRGGKTLQTKTKVWEKLSNEQKSRRAMYDYSSGIANPAELINLGRLAMSSLKIINQHLFTRSKLKTDKHTLNKQETKAAKEFVLWGLCLAAMTVGWMAFHRYVGDETADTKPEDYEHSLPSWTNFTEQKNYLKLIDQVAFRVIDSQTQLFNPYQFVDIVKSATVMTNAVDKWATLANWITEGNPDEAVTSDSKYKYFTKSQRWLWNALPLGNIQTWSSWRGNEKVGRWYFDNTITGKMFKWGGYKWKADQEKESKEDTSDSLTPDANQYLPDTNSLMPDPNQYLPEGY